MKKLLLAVLVVAIGCSKDDPEPAPTANFAFEGDNRFAPAKVTFSNTSINGVLYTWDFGDGNSSLQAEPEHIYEEGGIYTVTLTATTNDVNNKDVITKTVNIKNAPTKFQIDKITVTSIPFDNNGSNWDLGDGPDVYIKLADFKTGYYDNVLTTSLPLVYAENAGFPKFIDESQFNEIFSLGIYDYDPVPPDQFMGEYTFRVIDQIPSDGEDYPQELNFNLSTAKFKFIMNITWLP